MKTEVVKATTVDEIWPQFLYFGSNLRKIGTENFHKTCVISGLRPVVYEICALLGYYAAYSYYYYYYYYLLQLSFHSVAVVFTLVANKNKYT